MRVTTITCDWCGVDNRRFCCPDGHRGIEGNSIAINGNPSYTADVCPTCWNKFIDLFKALWNGMKQEGGAVSE